MKLANNLTPILELRAAGIPVGLGTDGAASNSTMGILEPMRLMTMLQKFSRVDAEAMPLNETLDLTFRGSASVLGMGDKIGRIEPGYLADCVLIDQSGAHHAPLHNRAASFVYNTNSSDVRTVICNGNVIMRDRQLLTLDKAEIISQVEKSKERLAYRESGTAYSDLRSLGENMIIFDTDMSLGTPRAEIDDGAALILLLQELGDQVAAITTVSGNAPIDAVMYNTHRLLHYLGREGYSGWVWGRAGAAGGS